MALEKVTGAAPTLGGPEEPPVSRLEFAFRLGTSSTREGVFGLTMMSNDRVALSMVGAAGSAAGSSYGGIGVEATFWNAIRPVGVHLGVSLRTTFTTSGGGADGVDLTAELRKRLNGSDGDVAPVMGTLGARLGPAGPQLLAGIRFGL